MGHYWHQPLQTGRERLHSSCGLLLQVLEVEQLKATTTKDIAQVFEPIFARFGVPRTVRMDNGPQFASAKFKHLVECWEANHITSSPYYAQSNGMTQCAVQTAKRLLKKSRDINLALLSHRATPRVKGFSSTATTPTT